MHVESRTLALALGLGVTLAACGGSEGEAPFGTPMAKALGTSSTPAQKDTAIEVAADAIVAPAKSRQAA